MKLNKSNIKDFLTGCLDNGIYVERLITNNFSDYLEKPELSDDDFQTLVSFMTTNGVLVKDEKGNYETVIGFQPGPGTVKYIITTSAGKNGQINPLGEIEVNAGEDFTYDVIADKKFVIDELVVDGEGIKDVSGLATYHGVIYNVRENHAIEVTFKENTNAPEV